MAASHYTELRNLILRRNFPNEFAPVIVRDADSHYVPIPISERFVQCLWYDQRLRAEALVTTDAQPVRVIFPGWWNLEAGPDFRHATIQIGDGPELTGDIEIHLRAEDWFHHDHHRDAAYDNVVLHVVFWEADRATPPHTRAGDRLPQLALQPALDAPLEQLYDEIDLDAYPHNVGNHVGRCGKLFRGLPDTVISSLLASAGDERLAVKARRFIRWTRASDAVQALYTGWMEALGYKNNKVAFRHLARRLPLTELRAAPPAAVPALLFGVANFLPTTLPTARDAAGQCYLKRLWNTWWKLRPDYEARVLPKHIWHLHAIRPANHPHRRLGTAAQLICRHPHLADELIGAVRTDGDPAKLFRQLRDEYWSTHFTLGGRGQRHATDLLGVERTHEILTNVVYPFVLAQAQLQGDDDLAARAREGYTALGPHASNSLIRLAAKQLFDSGTEAQRFLRNNRQQQGLLQIFHDFCLNDKSACALCQFPEMIERWAAAQ